jgi:CII-binding regulator of phage lambda lysogenization HflD
MEKEHFEVVLESIESKVQQVLECFSVLDKKIDDVRDELKHDNGILNVKITAVSDRLDRVEANLTNRIDAVDDKLTKRIDAVEDKLNKRIDAVEDKLTKRIDAVDEKLTKRIDAVHTELIAHRENVELHKVPRRRVLKQV